MGKVKLSVLQAMEPHRVARLRRSHIIYTIGSQLAVRLSALLASYSYPLDDSRYSFLLEAESTSGP
jgi:hypothetical protein